MINNLFHAVVQTLRRQGGAYQQAIPFALGRVYSTGYRNWKHDPKPLLFIIGSDAFHTVALNVHYVLAYQSMIVQFIMILRASPIPLTGLVLYRLLKQRLPAVVKLAFRKYYTPILRGRLVSEGISNLPEPNMATFVFDSFVRMLNNRIHPQLFSFNKEVVNPQQAEQIRQFAAQTQYGADTQKPFANNKGVIIQYREPGESQ